MSFSTHPATASDVPVLLEMIRELARFEHLEHEVEATPELLERALFGQSPVAGAVIGLSDGQVAGYAIYYFTFSSFVGRPGIWLEDVYVRPSFRKGGLGRALIEAVARVGVGKDCGRYEWTALNWNERALKFYDGLGAKRRDEWVLLRMNRDGLRRLGGAPDA
jgi:GNAT superfamily N-acetyltransferase